MKHNYLLYILLIFVVVFKSSILNIVNNITDNLFIKNDNLELKLIKKENEYLINQYQSLKDFKNNINNDSNYLITNVIKTNYGFDNLIISGTNYQIGSEVLSENGLVGIISKINTKNTTVDYIYNTNIVVKINNETGKITSTDDFKNIIVKEISNYNNVSLNDDVYSIHGSYIGKIIEIKYDVLDNYLTIKTVDLKHLDYVGVVERG